MDLKGDGDVVLKAVDAFGSLMAFRDFVQTI
jgi:hypothetical protein